MVHKILSSLVLRETFAMASNFKVALGVQSRMPRGAFATTQAVKCKFKDNYYQQRKTL